LANLYIEIIEISNDLYRNIVLFYTCCVGDAALL